MFSGSNGSSHMFNGVPFLNTAQKSTPRYQNSQWGGDFTPSPLGSLGSPLTESLDLFNDTSLAAMQRVTQAPCNPFQQQLQSLHDHCKTLEMQIVKITAEHDTILSSFQLLVGAVRLSDADPFKFNTTFISPSPGDRPNSETHTNIRFWNKSDYLTWLDSHEAQLTNCSKLPYLEQEDGDPVQDDEVDAIHKTLCGAFSELNNWGLAPMRWGNLTTLVDPSVSPIIVGDTDLPAAGPSISPVIPKSPRSDPTEPVSEFPMVTSDSSLSPLQQLDPMPEFPPHAVTPAPLQPPVSNLVPVALSLPAQQSAVDCPTVAPSPPTQQPIMTPTPQIKIMNPLTALTLAATQIMLPPMPPYNPLLNSLPAESTLNIKKEKNTKGGTKGKMHSSQTKNGQNLCALCWLKQTRLNGTTKEFNAYYTSLTLTQRMEYDQDTAKLVASNAWNKTYGDQTTRGANRPHQTKPMIANNVKGVFLRAQALAANQPVPSVSAASLTTFNNTTDTSSTPKASPYATNDNAQGAARYQTTRHCTNVQAVEARSMEPNLALAARRSKVHTLYNPESWHCLLAESDLLSKYPSISEGLVSGGHTPNYMYIHAP
ncbi:hypothetical protein BDR05DRAFT_997079 [Suillus weaverae]|nr:hypothetical protein BDR05DRAFT_997079 [Suillus weaverae]